MPTRRRSVTGVVLQNRAADPAHLNCVDTSKTPLHTLIASLAFKQGQRVLKVLSN